MARSNRTNKSLNFEKSLEDLESIIEKMEGEIGFLSRKDGTTFYFILPLEGTSGSQLRS